MKKIIISIVTALAIVGCGGGSSSSSTPDNNQNPTTTPDNNQNPTTTKYKVFIPLTDSPSTYTCSTEAVEGKFVLFVPAASAFFDITEAECDTYAQAWLNDFNHEDTPRTQEQSDALAWLNYIRVGTGLPTFKHNAKLEQAAANHENYLGDVKDTFGVNMGHYEDNASYPSQHYTGVMPTDRALAEGYKGYYAGDVISFKSSPIDSMIELSTGIYHRQAMFWNFIHEIGIGGVERNYSFASNPHLMGANAKADTFLRAISPVMVAYPFDGQVDVERLFREEHPDPLPNHTNTANPISVSFNSYHVSSVEMLSFKLFKGSAEISNVILMDKATDPNNIFTEYDFALFPLDVFDTNTEYRVEIRYIQDGSEKSKSWTFVTRG